MSEDDLILRIGDERDHRALPLATKRGRHIPNVRRMERAPDSLRSAVKLWARERPDAIFRTISATYNCVGLVFATRRTAIDIAHLGQIYDEDELRIVAEPELGDIAVYRDAGRQIQHVGLVVSVEVDFATARRSIMILSQWGADGEYVHEASHLPSELGRISEFWTDRRDAS